MVQKDIRTRELRRDRRKRDALLLAGVLVLLVAFGVVLSQVTYATIGQVVAGTLLLAGVAVAMFAMADEFRVARRGGASIRAALGAAVKQLRYLP